MSQIWQNFFKIICVRSDITYEELIRTSEARVTSSGSTVASDITYEELIRDRTAAYLRVNNGVSSDITYEELIHWHGKHVREDSWSDITYEELIQIPPKISPYFSLLSDITYEELIPNLTRTSKNVNS